MICAERREDYEAISLIHKEAFAPSSAEAALVSALRQTERYEPALSLIAFEDTNAAGHVLLYSVDFDSDVAAFKALALAPLGVRPPFQRRGYGTALVHEGLRTAHRRGYELAFVAGDPAYYQRFHFMPAGQAQNNLGIPPESFLMLALSDELPRVISGTLSYPEAFQLVR